MSLRGAVALVAVIACAAAPALSARAAAPDPTVATVLSIASTLGPATITAGLWGTGRGVEEGIRFDIGVAALAVGSILGPSIGQFYAESGTNAIVALLLRAVTGSVMLTGVGFVARGEEDDQGLGTALTVIGAVPTGLLALYDIIDASDSAVEAKRRRATASAAPVPELDIGGFTLCSSVAGVCGRASLSWAP